MYASQRVVVGCWPTLFLWAALLPAFAFAQIPLVNGSDEAQSLQKQEKADKAEGAEGANKPQQPELSKQGQRAPQPAIRRTTRQTQFNIPFSLSRSSDQVKEVRLYVSLDRGRTWRLAQAKSPADKGFPVRTPSDGIYWFASRTIDQAGRTWPQGELAPELEVWVDTTQPQLDLRAAPQPNGQLNVTWSAWDPLLQPNQLKLEFRQNGQWKPAAMQPRRMGSRLEGAISLPGDVQEVRALAMDQAGNRAIVSRTVSNNADQSPLGSTHGLAQTSPRRQRRSGLGSEDLSIPEDPLHSLDELRAESQPAEPSGSIAQRVSVAPHNPAPSGTLSTTQAPPTDPSDPYRSDGQQASSAGWKPRSESFAATRATWPATPTSTASTAPAARASVETAGLQRPRFSSPGTTPNPESVAQRSAGYSPVVGPVSGSVAPTITQRHFGFQPTLSSAPPAFVAPASNESNSSNLSAGVFPNRPPATLPADPNGATQEPPPTARPTAAPEPTAATPAPVRPEAGAQLPAAIPGSVTTTSPNPTAETPFKDIYAQWSNRTRFSVDYQLDSIVAEDVGDVELWATADGGASWSRWGTDPDRTSPVSVKIENPGVYGFHVVVVSKRGTASARPTKPEDADVWIGVDITPPTGRITSAAAGRGEQAGRLAIQWQAEDPNLGNLPITLSYSSSPAGPWSPIATEIENTGSYLWSPAATTPEKVFIRLSVADKAGNVAEHATSSAITLTGLRPRANIQSVQPRS